MTPAEIRSLLRQRAADVDVLEPPKAVPSEARWRIRRRQSVFGAGSALLALAVAGAVALAAISVLTPGTRFPADAPGTLLAEGEIGGEPWTLSAYRRGGKPCVELRRNEDVSPMCELDDPRGAELFVRTWGTSQGWGFILGTASARVESIQVQVGPRGPLGGGVFQLPPALGKARVFLAIFELPHLSTQADELDSLKGSIFGVDANGVVVEILPIGSAVNIRGVQEGSLQPVAQGTDWEVRGRAGPMDGTMCVEGRYRGTAFGACELGLLQGSGTDTFSVPIDDSTALLVALTRRRQAAGANLALDDGRTLVLDGAADLGTGPLVLAIPVTDPVPGELTIQDSAGTALDRDRFEVGVALGQEIEIGAGQRPEPWRLLVLRAGNQICLRVERAEPTDPECFVDFDELGNGFTVPLQLEGGPNEMLFYGIAPRGAINVTAHGPDNSEYPGRVIELPSSLAENVLAFVIIGFPADDIDWQNGEEPDIEVVFPSS